MSLLAGTTIATSGISLDPIAKPIAAVLAGIYSVVPNYGVAIIILSIIWMIIISPLTLKSTRSMLAMQKLQPMLKKLQEKHKNDRQAFAQAQMDLFKEHKVSPFGACLPMLLPLPVFFALFRVIDGLSRTVKVAGKSVSEPKYLSAHTQMYKDIVAAHGHLVAFGMNLAENAFAHHASFAAALPFFIVLLLQGGTSYFMQVQMMSRNQAARDNPQMATQMRMMKFIPLLFVVFCLRFPAGVVVYYTASNLCRIVQQDLMYRFDPKVKALYKREVIEVEAYESDIENGRPVQLATAGDGPAGSGQNGRSRFRDLLARAAEQQGARSSAMGRGIAGGGTSPRGFQQGGRATGAGRSGSSSNGGRPGAGQSGRKPASQGGHRTNRKRRRR